MAQEKIEWQQPPEKLPSQRKGPVRKARKNSHWRSIVALALLVGAFGTMGAVTIDLTVVKGAEIRAMEKEIGDIEAQNGALQVEVDRLRSPAHIESAALAMGMEKPSGTVYVAGDFSGAKTTTGVPASQSATQLTEGETSTIKKLSQIFTSFFASTQR